MITLIKSNGDKTVVEDAMGEPSLSWLQSQVGGWIEIVRLGDDQMIVNEEGKLKGLPVNQRATAMFRSHRATSDLIVGDVVLLTAEHRCG